MKQDLRLDLLRVAAITGVIVEYVLATYASRFNVIPVVALCRAGIPLFVLLSGALMLKSRQVGRVLIMFFMVLPIYIGLFTNWDEFSFSPPFLDRKSVV